MNIHRNARSPPIGRELLVMAAPGGQTPQGRRTSRRHLPADRAQVGGALCSGGPGRAPGPVITASQASPANAG